MIWRHVVRRPLRRWLGSLVHCPSGSGVVRTILWAACWFAAVPVQPAAKASFDPPGAVCRLWNQTPDGVTSLGSGALVTAANDGGRGLVLTCGHLFAEGAGRVVVQFVDGRTHGGRLIARDAAADLAAVEILNPASRPLPMAAGSACAGGRALQIWGFGPHGRLRRVAGPAVGEATSPGRSSLRIAAAVEQGDSGGPVLDEAGALVAVVWGESSGVTYASWGMPLRRFLARLRGEVPPTCPDGRCPRIAQPELAPSLPQPTLAPPSAFDRVALPPGPGGRSESSNGSPPCDSRLSGLEQRLATLERRQSIRSDWVSRAELEAFVREAEFLQQQREAERERAELAVAVQQLQRRAAENADFGSDRAAPSGTASGATRRAAGRAAGAGAATLLGLSGPWGAAVVVGAGAAGWLMARRRQRRRRGRKGDSFAEARPLTAASPSAEATAAAAATFPTATFVSRQQPIERDDLEARQLLRLSQLEGRDPLQDAVAGRLALDRLDAAADGDADPQRAAWADELRRELRERFNDISPTKFVVTEGKATNDERLNHAASFSPRPSGSGSAGNLTAVSNS